jgi:hypothetical protein
MNFDKPIQLIEEITGLRSEIDFSAIQDGGHLEQN